MVPECFYPPAEQYRLVRDLSFALGSSPGTIYPWGNGGYKCRQLNKYRLRLLFESVSGTPKIDFFFFFSKKGQH